MLYYIHKSKKVKGWFDDFWNYNILKDELLAENSKYIIALSNNEIVGFAGIKILLDEADIMNIVTKKIYKKQGKFWVNHIKQAITEKPRK